MAWPHWIETLKERYLADEASVFLLYGEDVRDGRWGVEGKELDCAHLMVHFLARGRPIVGLYRKQIGLQFPGIGDVGAFDRIIAVKDFADGEVLVLSDNVPEEALGKIWRALSSGVDDPQGYVIANADALWPLGKRLEMDVKGGPKMTEWPSHPTLRRSNNIVVLLTDNLDRVAPELVNHASVIGVDEPERSTLVPKEAVVVDEPPVDRPAATTPTPSDRNTQPPADGPRIEAELPDDLEERLHTAIRAALPQYDPGTFSAHLPVMHGVAAVFAAVSPDQCGELTFGLDEETGVYADGPGAEWFLSTWQSDITFNAAADMLVKELQPPDEGYTPETVPTLPDTPVRVLAKRIRKLT